MILSLWTLYAHIVSKWINSSHRSFERESHSRSHVSSMHCTLNIAIATEQTRPSELFIRQLIAALIVLAHGTQYTFIEMRALAFVNGGIHVWKRFWYWSYLSVRCVLWVYQTRFRRCTVHQFFLSYKSELDITAVVVVVFTVFGIIIIIIIISMSQSSTPTDIKLSLCTTATYIIRLRGESTSYRSFLLNLLHVAMDGVEKSKHTRTQFKRLKRIAGSQWEHRFRIHTCLDEGIWSKIM